ncbi:MAG: DUF3137 domain-containing protein [Phycisphaerales bacterium]|jgi:hypothetical protein|nr:DUF3137 domain-containing protein [Phycisphaerales bacterium]
MEPSVIILIVIVIAGFIAFSIYTAAKRRKELHEWAHSHGLHFNPGKSHDMDSRYVEFKCLNKGRNRYAYNIITGLLNQRQITAFDYRYTTGSGKNRKTHHLSAIIVVAPIPLEPLFIRREGFFDKVTEFFGADDIDFESAEFSRKFFVKSTNKKWAYDIIHQRMMEYLLNAPGFSIQFSDDSIIAWNRRTFTTGDFESAFDLIDGMIERFPEYLIKQQTGK